MQDGCSTVVVDLRHDERLELPGGVTVRFREKSGQQARLVITAPRDAKIQKSRKQKEPESCQA